MGETIKIKVKNGSFVPNSLTVSTSQFPLNLKFENERSSDVTVSLTPPGFFSQNSVTVGKNGGTKTVAVESMSGTGTYAAPEASGAQQDTIKGDIQIDPSK